MVVKVPKVDWLLLSEPRPAQVEALLRSYHGIALRDARDGPEQPRELPHVGMPASGWGHFMEMRVGKTPTMLNEFALFRRDRGVRRMIMLSPNKYKTTWALEVEKFGLDIATHVFESTNREAFLKARKKYGDNLAVFVNYEALQYENNVKALGPFIDENTYFGADESVFLKGRKSITSRVAIDLAKQTTIRRASSGKPTPQGVSDLYNQLNFIGVLEGWNYFQFRNKFSILGGFRGKQEVGVKNEDKLAELRNKVSFFARRKDWGTSIDSDYETVNLEMLPIQREAYADMEEQFMVWLEEHEVTITAEQVVTKHMKLQQISGGFIIDEEKNIRWLLPFDKTPKFLDIIDRLDNYEQNKVILLFHYTATGDALIEALRKRDKKVAIIRGGPYMKKFGLDADTEKKKFNEGDYDIMVGQTKAIKYGHTLMGNEDNPCLTTIYVENTYSLDDRSQTEERNQGEGQQASINIVDYVSSPVEQKVINSLQRKEQVASIIMGYYQT